VVAPDLAVTRFGTEGVVLDLASGSFFRVNEAGATACELLASAGTSDAAAVELARRYGIAPGDAARDLASVLASLARPREGRSSLAFTRDLTLTLGGEPVLALAGGEARLLRAVADPAATLGLALPHLLALAGRELLHASAVAQGGVVTAFLGPSGAGKTTLARLLAEERGATLVSSDLLPLVPGGATHVATAGEAAIHAFCAEQGPALARGPVATAALPKLPALDSPASPLAAIVVLDAARRGGATIETEPLDGASALVALLENGFAELGRRDVWLALLATSRSLVARVPVLRARVPEGVAALRVAARGYRWTSAS
jgi:hypothetical protein